MVSPRHVALHELKQPTNNAALKNLLIEFKVLIVPVGMLSNQKVVNIL